MAGLRVHVTEELIARATQADSRRCMIAEAIQLARPDFRQVIVDLATIRWTNPRTKKRYLCLTSEDAGRALVAFDQGHAIEPFSLTLKPIQVTPIKTRSRRPDGGYTERQSRGRKQLRPDGTIEGGYPLPTGHLSNRPPSNTTLSRNDVRVYGRRLLRG